MKLERLSHSQAGVWGHCEKSWDYGYRQRLVPKIGKTSYDLGTLVHELCAVYDQNLSIGIPPGSPIAWERVVNYATENWLDGKKPTIEMVQLYNRALSCVQKYILEFSPTVDQGLRIEDIEEHFEYELVTPKGRTVILEGYNDRTHIDKFGLRVMLDRKTNAQGKHRSERSMMIDPQLTLYAAIYREMGKPVDKVCIESMSTYPYKDYMGEPYTKLFQRIFSQRTDKELNFVLDNYGILADKIADTAETDGPFIRNLSYECPRCQYFELCYYEAKGLDTKALLTSEFKSKDDDRKEIAIGFEPA